MASSISAGTTSSTALVATADTTGALQLATNNGTTAVTIDTSQNVGIGTSSPSGKLHVTAAAGSQTGVYLGNQTAGARTDLHVWSASNADGYIFFERSGASENGYIRYSQASDFMAFQTASAERMRIDSSGNVGIGTTSPSVKFQVNHSSDVAAIKGSGGGVTLGLSNSSANDVLQRMTNNSSNFWDIRNISSSSNFSLDYNGTSRMTIDTSGSIFATSGVVCFTTSQYRSNVASSQLQFINNSAGVSLAVNGTSWGSLSDERDKEIIEPITDATSKVASLRSVIGRYKVDDADKRRAFLIAQDVKAVLPEAVTELEDEQQTLILQYTEVIPLLVAAIQEQQALITSLTARITALEGTQA